MGKRGCWCGCVLRPLVNVDVVLVPVGANVQPAAAHADVEQVAGGETLAQSRARERRGARERGELMRGGLGEQQRAEHQVDAAQAVRAAQTRDLLDALGGDAVEGARREKPE